MRATPGRDTSCELALRRELYGRGFRYRVDWPLPIPRRRADIAFPGARLAVFVDGCFWHGCPRHGSRPAANAAWWRAKLEANRRRDRSTDGRLRRRGWSVLRLWEHEVMSSPSAACDRVRLALARAGGGRATSRPTARRSRGRRDSNAR